MATTGAHVVCDLLPDGDFKLEYHKASHGELWYTGVVVLSVDKIMVVDIDPASVCLHRLQDGRLLAKYRLQQNGQDIWICNMHENKILMAVTLLDGQLEILSVECTDKKTDIKQVRLLKTEFNVCRGVKYMNEKLIVSGRIGFVACWGIVSITDGHMEAVHKICPSVAGWSCLCTNDRDMVYIAHFAGDAFLFDSAIYGYRSSKCEFVYKHPELRYPVGITADREGFIFACNMYKPCCIHQLTESGQPLKIHSPGILPSPRLCAIFCDEHGCLYITCRWSNVITRYRPRYSHQQEGLIRRFMRSVGLGSSQKKLAIKHSQGKQTVPSVLVSDERKQPVNEKTSAVKEHGVVDQGQSSVKREVPPAIKVPVDLDADNQGSVIPVEILRMDDKSLQLYKKALQDGKEKVYNIRVMVVGQYGVGKTTLTKRLLGQQVDISKRTSTEGIDVYKHCCKIALNTGEWIAQHEDSDQLSQLQRLVKLLTPQTERPEVSDEQGGQTEVIYKRETTKDVYSPVHYSDSDDDDDTSTSSSEKDFEQEADNTKNQSGEPSSLKVDQGLPAMEASGVNIQEGGRHVTSKVDATMEFLQLVVEKADKLEKSLVEYAALAMWDFAGQYIFYTTHQTFLTCHAIYLLVTDLSQHITDFVKDDECYFDTEGVKLCKVQDLVEVWMNSVHCCAASSIANTAVTSPAAAITMTSPALTSHGASTSATFTDVSNAVIPPVILVGTHADKIQQDKRQEVIRKYFDQICFILKDKPAFLHLKDFFPIDNTQFDPQLETLKKRIFELASKQPYWGQEVPASWLPLEASLMKLKASGIKVIPYSLVEEMNQAGAVPIKTTEQLDLFLRFQHETGNFIYFSVEGLREWLVLDPAWLIDALKSLITADTFIFKNNPAIQSKLFEFRDKGKLTAELIDAIWTKEKHPEFHYYKEIILQLMEKLNIVARPSLYNLDTEEVKVEGYFLAPCMLRMATPEKYISLGPNSQQRNTSVICFVFTGKFLPSPVFHRLLAACVAQWPIAKHMTENLIFCGCCLFDLDLHHRLTVLFMEHVIFAGVTRIGTTDKSPSSIQCIKVREFITRTLSSIIGCLGQSLLFELSIQCPNSDRYSVHCHIPVAILQGNVDVPCHFHDNSHMIISRDVLKIWFQEEEQSADGSSSGPMPSPPTSDTDRFMCIAYLLNDVGSKVLRKLFYHMVITPTCTLDQYLANNDSTIEGLLKKRVLNASQMDIMFPPNGDDTNLDEYDITLLSALFISIVPSLGHQELNLVKGLRDDRNKLYGHTKSCMMNANDFHTCWSNISSTLITLSQQCGDPNFETEILKEIQQTRVPDASYLSILQAWFSRIERVEQRLESSET